MRQTKQAGFTMVEMMLAMAFVAMLLVAIAMTTIQLSQIYTKGMTMRAVDQAGRSLSERLSRDVATSSPINLPAAGEDASVSYFATERGGRLCLGSYTYAWTPAEYLRGESGSDTPWTQFSDGTPARMVRLADPGAQLCRGEIEVYVIESDDIASEFLVEGDRELAMHSFSVSQTVRAGYQALYQFSFMIGTNEGTLLSGGQCAPPAEVGIGDEYCALNEFNLLLRAGNREG